MTKDRRGMKVVTGADWGKEAKGAEEVASPFDAIEDLIRTSPETLGDSYDFLRLLGAVVGRIALLDVATNSTDSKAVAAAARVLVDLKESPDVIADRLRSSQFSKLSMTDLQSLTEMIRRGDSPQEALDSVLKKKEA